MKRLWIAFTLVVIISFAVLGWRGFRIYQEKPPIPSKVVTTEGATVIQPGDILEGQNVWQAMGGMELGSIWGHGSYVAPDWSADWLHSECVFILDKWSNAEFGHEYKDIPAENQAMFKERLKTMMRRNTYDPSRDQIVIDPIRQKAFEHNLAHYQDIFTNGKVEYAIPAGTISDPGKLRQLASFFFWTSWSASTNRQDEAITYTSNWPHEPLIDNVPTSDSIIWTGLSIIMLLGGIGLMVWYHASRSRSVVAEELPSEDPLLGFKPTPSQLATIKYFWTVAGLFLLQMVMGVISAHYGVEGTSFYGIPLSHWIPYTLARTWHTQLGIF